MSALTFFDSRMLGHRPHAGTVAPLLELPPNFDRTNPEHYARLLLVLADMGEVKAPDPLLVLAKLGFEVIPHTQAGVHGTYDLVKMQVSLSARKEAGRRAQAAHEAGHIIQQIVGLSKPHGERFTDEIAGRLWLPSWSSRPLVERYGAYSPHLAKAFPTAPRMLILQRAQHLLTASRRARSA